MNEIMASLREKVREELIKYWKGGFDKYKYSDDYKYYVNDINKNLIGGNMDDAHRKMFENGSGSELKDTPAKAKAIDSSSMLAYNFFRNINDKCTIAIDHVEYNKVFFEVKLQTLKGSSTPANLDVVLVSKDKQTVLFIESKFLEYLENGAAEFSDSYTKEDSYFIDNKVAPEHFYTVSGYGHDDLGKEVLDNVFAQVFKAEAAFADSGDSAAAVCADDGGNSVGGVLQHCQQLSRSAERSHRGNDARGRFTLCFSRRGKA